MVNPILENVWLRARACVVLIMVTSVGSQLPVFAQHEGHDQPKPQVKKRDARKKRKQQVPIKTTVRRARPSAKTRTDAAPRPIPVNNQSQQQSMPQGMDHTQHQQGQHAVPPPPPPSPIPDHSRYQGTRPAARQPQATTPPPGEAQQQ